MKWQIKLFDRLVSTNETAKQYPLYTVVTATRQTGGKGRYGRVWESPPGNLYLSAVAPDFGEANALLAFVAGVAVADALGDFHVQIKWPNDILLNGKKVAGILLERREDGLVVIGIGLNLISHPTENMLYPTACLNGKLSLTKARTCVLESLEKWLDTFERDGFAPVRTAWLRLAVGMNENIKVNLPTKTITGRFKELSPQGELVLETPDKAVQKISAGDVFLL